MKLRHILSNIKLLKFDSECTFYLAFTERDGIMNTHDFLEFKKFYFDKVEWFELLKNGLITQKQNFDELYYIEGGQTIKTIEGRYTLSNSKKYFDGLGMNAKDDLNNKFGIVVYDDLKIEIIKEGTYEMKSSDLGFGRGGSSLYCYKLQLVDLEVENDTKKRLNNKPTVSQLLWEFSAKDIGNSKLESNIFDYKIDIQLIDNKVICLLEGGEVVAIRKDTGEVAWVFEPEDHQMVIQISEDKLYSAGVYLYEINPENGEVLRSMPVLDEITKNGFESFYSPMSIYGDYAVLWHSFTMEIFLINLRDFRFEKMLRIKINWGRKKLGIPIIFNATIIYHNGLLCILDDSKKLFILEKEDFVQEIIISKEAYLAIADLPESAIKVYN